MFVPLCKRSENCFFNSIEMLLSGWIITRFLGHFVNGWDVNISLSLHFLRGGGLKVFVGLQSYFPNANTSPNYSYRLVGVRADKGFTFVFKIAGTRYLVRNDTSLHLQALSAVKNIAIFKKVLFYYEHICTRMAIFYA